MPSKLKQAIGAVKDQTSISLAKVASNNSSNIDVAVLKATSHEKVPIDERYVHEILQLVSSNKGYAAACAKAIGKRIGRTRNWIVAIKCLMLVLRLFQDGDPYFPREVLHAMKRGAKILNLNSFRDDSNSSPWDYTAYVRSFALYLDERLDCFLTGKLQRRYTNKDKERGHGRSRRNIEAIRDMKPVMLLDRIPFWQRLLDRAIATRPTGAAQANRLVQISLYAIVQESFDLYSDISDGLTHLLDGFFHLQYNSCVSAFQICVKAKKQYEELAEFYSFCKSVGVGRTSEYPSRQTISDELVETLQEFLKDQSSFPSVSKSPQRLALPAPPAGSQSARHESYGGLSEFSYSTSKYSQGVSDFSSQCTSLEDLISATENGTSQQGISIDLEAYTDQFEKNSQKDETFRTSDAGSTHSLPVTNSIADLLSLDDWPEQGRQTEEEQKQKQDQQQQQQQTQLNSATSWELVLAEAIQAPSTQPEPNVTNTFNAFSEQEQKQKDQETSSREGLELVIADVATQPMQHKPDIGFSLEDLYNQPTTTIQQPSETNLSNTFPQQEQKDQEKSSREGWELVLAESTAQPTQQTLTQSSSLNNLYDQQTSSSPQHYNPLIQASSLDSLYDQQTLSSPQHYNPFLQEVDELSIIPAEESTSAGGFEADFSTTNMFSAAPTFQATPTFSVENPNNVLQNENDPFAALTSEQMLNGSTNQHNLLQEQQLWLQQQNKIIGKHIT